MTLTWTLRGCRGGGREENVIPCRLCDRAYRGGPAHVSSRWPPRDDSGLLE